MTAPLSEDCIDILYHIGVDCVKCCFKSEHGVDIADRDIRPQDAKEAGWLLFLKEPAAFKQLARVAGMAIEYLPDSDLAMRIFEGRVRELPYLAEFMERPQLRFVAHLITQLQYDAQKLEYLFIIFIELGAKAA